MTTDFDVDAIFNKYGDKTSYTEEEEQAMEQLLEVIADEFPNEGQWRKLARKDLLITVVRSFNLDVKFAMECISKIMVLITETYPDLIAPINPQKIKPLFSTKMIQVVKREVDEGPAIVVFRLKYWDPSKANVEELLLAVGLYMGTLARHSAAIQRAGYVIIADIEGFKFAHAKVASVDLVLKGIRFHSAIPQHLIKGVHVINSIYLFEKTYNFFKWMLPQKIKNMINITKKDMTYLYSLVAKEKLPNEFGGIIPDNEAYYDHIEAELNDDPMLISLIEKLQHWFLQNNKNINNYWFGSKHKKSSLQAQPQHSLITA